MKIAILITGQMRDSFITYLNHVKQFIEPNNADIFVATSTKNFWYSNEIQSLKTNQKNFIFHLHSEKNREEIINEIKNYYGQYLKDYFVSQDEKIPEKRVQPDYYSYFINNQFNNNKIAFKLALNYEKKNNFKYDLFVRLRIDKTVFPKKMILNKHVKLPIVTHVEPCQFFFIGDKNMMEYYCNFTYLENYKYNPNIKMPDPPAEILKHIKNKYHPNIIHNILTIYQKRDGKGTIGDFPYLIKKSDDVGWNAYRLEPKQFDR